MKAVTACVGAVAVVLVGYAAPVAAAGEGAGYNPEMQGQIDKMMQDLQQLGDEKTHAEKNLQAFDAYAVEVFNGQQWDRLGETHAPDVVVHWPCGYQTQGIQAHKESLAFMFVYAPDTRIQSQAVKIGSGDYTAVTGVMTGTFSQPMPKNDGGAIEPTGKQFSLNTCTVGRWQDGVMVEKWYYYDNAAYLRQMGIGQ
jgi:predicted ester cyclase